MGLFGFGKAQTFDPSTAGLDPALLAQLQGDIQGVRDVAQGPVTGVSQTGLAAQDLAKGLFATEQDRLGRQQGLQTATAISNASRFGLDSGGAERINQGIGQQDRKSVV